MAIDTEEKRASAASAGTWLTRVLRPTGSVSTADRVFIVREYTGLDYAAAAIDAAVGYRAVANAALDYRADGEALLDFRSLALRQPDYKATGAKSSDFRADGDALDYRAIERN